MSHESSSSGPVELVFDVAKPSGPVELLGLLDRAGNSDNALWGVFNWTCEACGAVNRSTATIRPQETCLKEWSCDECSRTTLVQFRARAAGDWIKQHSLAVAGQALCGSADTAVEDSPDKYRPSGQRIFAWIAIPALAIIILLEASTAWRLRSSSASPHDSGSRSSATSYAWLGGRWVGEDPDDMLFFGYLNPKAQTGSYTKVSRSGRPAGIVRFEIVHDEVTADRLVLRELPPSPDDPAAHAAGPEAILYISRPGGSMIRMTLDQGEPLIKSYRHVNEPPAD